MVEGGERYKAQLQLLRLRPVVYSNTSQGLPVLPVSTHRCVMIYSVPKILLRIKSRLPKTGRDIVRS